MQGPIYRYYEQFLPTPSARRATSRLPSSPRSRVFLPTPSARRATGRVYRGQKAGRISTHALREEGDLNSIHRPALRSRFLPTPSARRASRGRAERSVDPFISTHALREEGDGYLGRL